MNGIPTRWRTKFLEDLADAHQCVETAEQQLKGGDGGRALQAAYRAAVAAATVRVWLAEPPWQRALGASELQRRVRDAFPNRFGALAVLDLRDVLTSPWTVDAAGPYVGEARSFVEQIQAELEACLGQG